MTFAYLVEDCEAMPGDSKWAIDAAKMGCHIFHGPYVYNFHEIYDYLNSKNISEKINKPEILAQKLMKNFNIGFEKNDKNIEKLSSYSDKIFKDVIQEYNRFIK